MKTKLLILTLISSFSVFSQVVINEVQPSTNTVELKNLSSDSVDVTAYALCQPFKYTTFGSIQILMGTKKIAPNGFLVVKTSFDMSITDGSLMLYSSSSFSNNNDIVDYIEWGSYGHGRSNQGVASNNWTVNDFIAGVDNEKVIQYIGSGDLSADYQVVSTASFGEDNVVTGIEKQSNTTLEIYPLPVQNQLNFGVEVASYKVMSVDGQILLQSNGVSSSVDVSALQEGCYLLQLEQKDGFKTYKVVK